jgi:hypothetical protein
MRPFFFFLLLSFATQVDSQQLESGFKKINDVEQGISFQIPTNWTFEAGVLTSGKIKVGEISGFLENCKYKNGVDFIKQLKQGYEDEPSSTKFITSDSLTLDSMKWTKGVRRVEMWDGKGGSEKWFSIDYFTILNGRCFLFTFYSKTIGQGYDQVHKQILKTIQVK